MANQIRFKRASGSDPSASDLAIGEPGLRTDTAELFFKKDDGTIAKVSGGGGGPDFKYLELRNAANNGAASYPGNDFTLVTAGTTNAISPAAANTLLLSVSGVIQKPNSGTSTSGITGFIVDGSRLKWATNIPAAPDFILYQESGGIGEPSDETVTEAKLQVSNSPVNGYFLSAQSGNTGGLTWAAPVATSCTGNSATATSLATARAINGVNFDGTSAITVTAAAGTLSGNTLNSSVVTSSLTSLGDLAGLTVDGDINLTFANGYSLFADQSGNFLRLGDSVKLQLGNTGDLEIFHDGTRSHILNSTDELRIRGNDVRLMNAAGNEHYFVGFANSYSAMYYDNIKKFATTSTGFEADGGQFRFNGVEGGASQLLIYADEGDDLNDRWRVMAGGSNDFVIGNLSDASWDTNIKAFGGGAAELYHNGSKKLETTSSGATVTGTLTATAFSGDGAGLSGIASFPSGTKMLFAQASAPTGWTKQTSHDNKALRLVTGGSGGGSGGSNSFGTAFNSSRSTSGGSVSNHTLSTSQIPAHNHGMQQKSIGAGCGGNHSYTGAVGTFGCNNNSTGISTFNTGGGGSHNHGFTNPSLNLNVAYVDVIMAAKD